MNELTIVIPVYNEADNIRKAISKIEEKVATPHEIYIVYDMEEDTTISVIHEIASNYQNTLSLVKNKYGRGVLNAIKTGLEEAKSEFVIVTMADLSDPPEVMNTMLLQAQKKGADLVCGSRYMKGGKQIGGPFLKGLFSRVAGVSLHWLTRIPTHDISNSFKMYRKSMLDAITIESKGGFEIGMEITVKAYIAGYKITEVPTTWNDRTDGKSNFKLWAWLPNYLHWYGLCVKSKY
ncbi:MAG: Polyprenol monophosphomannose synthase [Candidatus Ordinivivax streblomastigis]|uniref:Polyprenol monophosphomannose synthase n=1 Tax=Candidatus Ordinivivax streblomastigis TaxID=2540710 RepID=A0A5M8P3J4_9BACT|nr:MAG: Polyprenol monophosphomannose synthase [Candidatus Ordinivivax streblomastigis]